MFFQGNPYCRHGSGNSGCIPCAIEGAYKALHEDNLKIIGLLNSQSAQQSVQRTCPHVETFINPISGYVECLACGDPLHEASR